MNQRRVRRQRKAATRECVETILRSAAKDKRLDEGAATATRDSVEGLGPGLDEEAALANLSVINEGSDSNAANGADSAVDDKNFVDGIVMGRNVGTTKVVEDFDAENILTSVIKESEKPPFVRKVDYKDIDYRSDEESFHSAAGEVNEREEVPTDHSIIYTST